MSKKEKRVQNPDELKRMRRRRRKWLKIGIPVLLAAAVVFIYSRMSGTETDAAPVYTDKAFTGDITTHLSTSGNVKAESTKTFFAPADTKIAGVEVSKGDIVKAGDVLVCFDEEAVAYAKRQSELETQISSADYRSNVQYNDEQKQKLAEAEAEIAQYEVQIDNYEIYIEDLTNGITDTIALKKADLYAEIYSVEKEMNTYDLAIQTPNEDTDMDALLRKKTEKQNELNKLNNELSLLSDYKTDYGWEDLLTQAKKDLADCETKLSEAKAKKQSAEAAIVDNSKLVGYQLNQQKSQLVTEDASKKYEEVVNGVVAEFDGVVTDMNVVDGAPVQEGAQLMVLESFEDICVEFQASKYDLETLSVGQEVEVEVSGRKYEGTVSKINHMAEQNNSGVPMVGARVHINNPDENIYLGIEAKLKILTASETNVLLVPVEAVNMDSDGSFCYTIENGILKKKYVQTGISSEEYIQILDGLSDGEEIVTSAYMGIDLAEGTTVAAMPAE
ncbi:MAG: efflux RND transporter periplasmic adaptor subunit [Lachnospiraceae bacterium]|nr:efflux RND transporter periplasmic adaptor subunit [Lachnospiraceae bacterium]